MSIFTETGYLLRQTSSETVDVTFRNSPYDGRTDPHVVQPGEILDMEQTVWEHGEPLGTTWRYFVEIQPNQRLHVGAPFSYVNLLDPLGKLTTITLHSL